MNTKVSILIPCYNADRWIAQAITTAFDQPYPDEEWAWPALNLGILMSFKPQN